MPRIARIVIPGCPHHVTQRGNNQQDVFFVNDDRQAYLQLLLAQSAKFGLRLHAYCLMTNHVHLIVTPERELSLAKAMGRAHYLYTLYINRLHGRGGHLWQNRFYSCPLGEDHLWNAFCYVERNPVRAGIVKRAWKYAWSSAAGHCGESPAELALDNSLWSTLSANNANQDWKQALVDPQDDQVLRQVRRSTHTGLPLAGDSFLSKLERTLGRRLRAMAIGRPKGSRKKQGLISKIIGDCP